MSKPLSYSMSDAFATNAFGEFHVHRPGDGSKRQCLLRRNIPGAEQHQVSWIPVKYAVKGKMLKLKENGEWEAEWRVEEVY